MEYSKNSTYDKSRIINETVLDLVNYKEGLFVTLNSLSKDVIKFDGQLEVFMHWLRKYCYGANYKIDESRLRVVGAFEVGSVNQGLHIHLVIMYNNDTDRTFEQLEEFIRRKWYALIVGSSKAKKYGSLVDVQKVGGLKGRVGYFTKTYSHFPDQFNLRYF